MTSKWPKDNQSALIKFYGDPGTRAVADQLVKITPPFKMYYEGKPVKTLTFHKKAAPSLLAALTKVWNYYDCDQAAIDRLRISSYAGTYNPRKVRGSATKWSNHAFGAAIDLDAEHNGFNTGKGSMPMPVVAAFKSEGATWGGDYKGRTDPMHFEFCDRGEPEMTFEQWLVKLGGAKPKAKAVEVAATAPQPFLSEVKEDFVDPEPPRAVPPVEVKPLAVEAGVNEITVKGDPDIWHIQRRLDAMKYFPGDLDGKWGGKTGGAITGFLNDRGSSLPAPTSVEMFRDILEPLKAQISKAETEVQPDGSVGFTRPIAKERAEATSADVAKKIETVDASKSSKLWAWVLGIPSAITAFVKGVADNFETALQSPLLNNIKEFFADNILLVALGVVGIAGVIWYKSSRAEKGTVTAYQEGRLT